MVAHSVSCQTNRDFIGNYKLHQVVYGYALTLKDSGKFIVKETSDLFSRTATGTWTLENKHIKLAPITTGENDSLPPFQATIITVGKKNELFLKSSLDHKSRRMLRKHVDPKEWYRLTKVITN
jgi:hypothetical protein